MIETKTTVHDSNTAVLTKGVHASFFGSVRQVSLCVGMKCYPLIDNATSLDWPVHIMNKRQELVCNLIGRGLAKM